MNVKKGQAAMEYMTTYGWAVLVIAIVLVALIWLGVFNPSGKIGEGCNLQPGIKCVSIVMFASPASSSLFIMNAQLSNVLDKRITVCNIDCTDSDTLRPHTALGNCASAPSALKLAPGESGVFMPGFTFQCFDSAGDEMTGKVGGVAVAKLHVYYVKEGDALNTPRVNIGDVRAKVIGTPYGS